MNETIIDFFNKLNVDEEKVNSLEGSKIKRDYDINPILARYSFFKPRTEAKKISIADVVGYDYQCLGLEPYLLDNLSRFFDRDGDGYHRRSISMLDIPQGQVINQLKGSFEKEPMCLVEIEKGVYNVGNNGMHRFHVIKTHYLNELSKLNLKDKEALKKLNEKYSFDAKISEMDFVKSYSAFLLNALDKDLSLELHFDSNYELTGKTCLKNYSKPDEKIILNDDQLVEMVQKKINHFLSTAPRSERKQFNQLVNEASKYKSFQNYYGEILMQNQNGGLGWN